MQLIKFNPTNDIATIENEISSMLKDGWDWFPEIAPFSALDMYEEDGMLVTETSLPQFKKKEVEVAIDASGIEITANHSDSDKKDKKSKRRYYRQENSRNYWRRVSLPPNTEWSKAEATFQDGLLTVRVPLNEKESRKLLELK